MFFCYNCNQKTNITNGNYNCLHCGSGAIEQLNQQNSNYEPYQIRQNNHQSNISQNNNSQNGIPHRNISSMMRMMMMEDMLPLMNFNNFMPISVSYTMAQPTGIIRYVIMSEGGPTQQQKNPVSQDKISKLEKIRNVQECPVCQQSGGAGIKLPCKHAFHDNCIIPWFKQKNTCPCCRNTV